MTDSYFGEIIFRYTRAQALDDGVLFDVSRHAIALGYDKRVPVAITQAVHEWCARRTDEAGRLANEQTVLDAAFRAIMAADREESGTNFTHPGFPDYGLRVEIGPGDDGEPVLTIGLPWDF